MDLSDLIGRIWTSKELADDFEAIVDCGGRFSGTESERKARDFLKERLGALAGPVQAHSFPFNGWVREGSTLELLGAHNHVLSSTALVMSPATPAGGIELELVDIGRGTPEDFACVRDAVRGRAVLVRHEFPFTTGHVHRRRKYQWAKEMGAAAFLIANSNQGGGPVSGSSGRCEAEDIPAVGISYEAGEVVSRASHQGYPRIRLEVKARRQEWQPENLYAEIPGQTDEWVVLCAHYDGHDLAESAMDNGSGVAAVLEAVRRIGPHIKSMRRGLRVMFFTVEEWGLYGSSLYVNGLSETEKRKIPLAINLDTVVGHPRLFALTSGLDDVEAFVLRASAQNGVPVTPVRPVLANSDHFNFFLGGIPSLRLIAGYEDDKALTRFLLTPGDTRDKVDIGQLRVAAMTTATLVYEACSAAEPPGRYRSQEEVHAGLDTSDPWVKDRVKK